MSAGGGPLPAGRRDRLAVPVVLIGPMGAGKSTVGKRAAKTLGVPFTDTDREIVREHGPIEDLFAQQGEDAFRRLETTAVHTAVRSGGVVAVGGGAVTREATRTALAGCRVVLLTVSAEAVAERIAGTARPLLATGGVDAWTAIADARAATYTALADVVVDTSRRPMSRVADEVVAWIREAEQRDADRRTTAQAASGPSTTALHTTERRPERHPEEER